HFYVVRIAGVETVIEDSSEVTKYYDVYRGIYTNEMSNPEYVESTTWSINDPRQDFNNLEFKYSDLTLDVNFENRINTDVVSVDITNSLDTDAGNYTQFLPSENKTVYGAITTNSDYI